MSNKLELRMYGLVPYNISPIQQAIQFGHAVVEYGQKVKGHNYEQASVIYNDWANNWKTFIIYKFWNIYFVIFCRYFNFGHN